MTNGDGSRAPREAVILGGVRTPFGKRNGQFSTWHPVEMLSFTLRGLIERTGVVDPALVEDVIGGCVGQVGEQALNVTRQAWLDAGLPESTPATTVDRQCGSGLQAIQFAAQGVMAGGYDLVVACGVENMSRVPLGSNVISPERSPMTPAIRARYGVDNFNQAIGAEMIARKWGLSRAALDEFSARSHERAANATAKGWLAQEILPVPADGGTIGTDQGIRADTTSEKLAGLKPAFEGLEFLTAGNSSQISDGAGAVLIASREKAEELGIRPRARFVGFSQVGSDPVMMLTGPIPATRKVLQRTGMSIDDIDLFEVNEAFAPVCLAWQEELGVGIDRLNVNGGAIALGHPLGASGTRLILTALNELERRDGQYALTAICEGGGMANAAIIERLGN
jgi:acetyl-CoA acyltransferase